MPTAAPPPKSEVSPPLAMPVRNLVLILGDQCDRTSSAFDGFDPATDLVWMVEVRAESTVVPSHKVRTANFFSCMRHFTAELRAAGRSVFYRYLDDPENAHSFDGELALAIARFKPKRLVVVEPGEYRVRELLRDAAKAHRVPLEERRDRHFLSSLAEFEAHAKGRKSLRLEFYYRELRKRTGILMDGTEPVGGSWNYDAENRGSFGKKGPGLMAPPHTFPPDKITQDCTALVEREFADNPGSLAEFNWPVTVAEAEQALEDFITYRLPTFGLYQDAMWTDEPYLYHARISSAMNLKLLDPRKVIAAAEAAYKRGDVPLAACEGFVRQILGWREYVRGVYWHFMPDYLERNALGADQPLPGLYWTGDTDMNCLRHAVGQTLQYGYAHHIQRLMVTGLFSLLLGVEPKQIHEWYLAMYIDAIEWVEVPNVIGMSQYADGGLMASKPYAASGKYIDRMSNYCKGCKYDPGASVGESACPFTTLYWDFLMRHEDTLRRNNRTVMQVKNLDRVSGDTKDEIKSRAKRIKLELAATSTYPKEAQ